MQFSFQVASLAASYEHRLTKGNKSIYHLEAFVAKFMSVYMRFVEETMDGFWWDLLKEEVLQIVYLFLYAHFVSLDLVIRYAKTRKILDTLKNNIEPKRQLLTEEGVIAFP